MDTHRSLDTTPTLKYVPVLSSLRSNKDNVGVMVWGYGKWLFAVDVVEGRVVCSKRYADALCSVDCCSTGPVRWLCAEEKIIRLMDAKFEVLGIWRLRKRIAKAIFVFANDGPGLAAAVDGGDVDSSKAVLPSDVRILVADKFGDVFCFTETDLNRITRQVEQDLTQHTTQNPNDDTFTDVLFKIGKANSPNDVDDMDGVVTTSGVHHQPEEEEEGGVDEVTADSLPWTRTAVDLNAAYDGLPPSFGHLAQITDVCLSVDGKRLIIGDRDEKVRVCRGAPSFVVTDAYLIGHTEFITSVVEVQTVHTQWSARVVRADIINSPTEYAFAVSASGDKTLRLWDARRGDCLDIVQCPDGLLPTRMYAVPTRRDTGAHRLNDSERGDHVLVMYHDSTRVDRYRLCFKEVECSALYRHEGCRCLETVSRAEDGSAVAIEWKVTLTRVGTVQLPDVPLALMVANDWQYSVWRSCAAALGMTLSDACDQPAQPLEAFWWISQKGILEQPLTIGGGVPVFCTAAGGSSQTSSAGWRGELMSKISGVCAEGGSEAGPMCLNLWKHTRVAHEPKWRNKRSRKDKDDNTTTVGAT